jgi:hypothetical protein
MLSHFRRILIAVVAMTASLAALGVSSALATPKGEYAVFAQCPTSNEEVTGCLVARTESGGIKIGNKEVPIVNVQTLQGGTENIPGGYKNMVAASDGETFSKTSQKVPGGLASLINCNEITGGGLLEKLERGVCEALFESGVTGVNATPELAVPASSVLLNLGNAQSGAGSTLTLPIKVKLENPLLGSECYIGSNEHPITLELTTGKSGALTGELGAISTKAEGGILAVANSKLVDGTFSAPGVTGCGGLLSGFLDPIIDAKLALPATSGNTATLVSSLEIANAELVRFSE